MQAVTTAIPPHELCAWLIALSGLTRAEIARATGNNPANLSQWLQGRSKMLSEERQQRVLEWLGIRNGKLDASNVHRWKVGNDFTALRGVLQATETPATLKSVSIHQVDTDHSHNARSPVLLAIPRPESPTIILIERPSSAGRHPLRLDSASLGIGSNGNDLQIAPSHLLGNNDSLPTSTLLRAVHIEISDTGRGKALANKDGKQHEIATSDQLLLDKERIITILGQDIRDLRCHEAGLRGVIRAMLKALRELDAKHPLLDKANRDKIYQEYYLNDLDKS